MDKFELEGKTYVAKDAPAPFDLCSGCVFDPLPSCTEVQECCAANREDNRDIIWVEVEEA